MKDIPKIVTSQSKIRFQDCDPFNHLNNASYINYFMNHREDMLVKHYDIDIYEMAKTIGMSWVSSNSQIAYLRPALLMETVTIESQLVHYTKSELYVEMRMYNNDKSELKSIIWCGFTHFNLLKQSRQQHSDELMEFFKEINNPIKDITSFDQRLKDLKSKNKKLETGHAT